MISSSRFIFSIFLLIAHTGGISKKQESRPVCWDAPDASTRFLCLQLTKWDQGSRRYHLQHPSSSRPSFHRFPHPTTPVHCMDIQCICNFQRGRMYGSTCILPNGKRLGKAIRKEYRLLSDDERRRFHDVFFDLKRTGEWDRFSMIHTEKDKAGSAHAGPGFLPWHREYIKRFEILLRIRHPDLALPYWDSTLDGVIPDPSKTSLFSSELLGNADSNGYVTDGAFRNWRGDKGYPIQRRMGKKGRFLKEEDLNQLMSEWRIERVLAFSSPQQGCPYQKDYKCFEYLHGNPHNFLGGDMELQESSTNDPLFFLHHSFIDMQWERWRTQKQSRGQRETEWPSDNDKCSSEAHFSQLPLGPFHPMINRDGLSNQYTDNLYTYAPRPTCSLGENCGSKFLFCDRSHGYARCASRILNGGNCGGYTRGESMCYNGQCSNGYCIPLSPSRAFGRSSNRSSQWGQRRRNGRRSIVEQMKR